LWGFFKKRKDMTEEVKKRQIPEIVTVGEFSKILEMETAYDHMLAELGALANR